VEELDKRFNQTDINMLSITQRIEDIDKKLQRFFTAMLTSASREIANLETTLRAEIENRLAVHSPAKEVQPQESAADEGESAAAVPDTPSLQPLFSFIPLSNDPRDVGDGRSCSRHFQL